MAALAWARFLSCVNRSDGFSSGPVVGASQKYLYAAMNGYRPSRSP